MFCQTLHESNIFELYTISSGISVNSSSPDDINLKLKYIFINSSKYNKYEVKSNLIQGNMPEAERAFNLHHFLVIKRPIPKVWQRQWTCRCMFDMELARYYISRRFFIIYFIILLLSVVSPRFHIEEELYLLNHTRSLMLSRSYFLLRNCLHVYIRSYDLLRIDNVDL